MDRFNASEWDLLIRGLFALKQLNAALGRSDEEVQVLINKLDRITFRVQFH